MGEWPYPAAAAGRDDWTQVYTGLDWVERWMADRGYTEAEIAYVLGAEALPDVA